MKPAMWLWASPVLSEEEEGSGKSLPNSCQDIFRDLSRQILGITNNSRVYTCGDTHTQRVLVATFILGNWVIMQFSCLSQTFLLINKLSIIKHDILKVLPSFPQDFILCNNSLRMKLCYQSSNSLAFNFFLSLHLQMNSLALNSSHNFCSASDHYPYVNMMSLIVKHSTKYSSFWLGDECSGCLALLQTWLSSLLFNILFHQCTEKCPQFCL